MTPPWDEGTGLRERNKARRREAILDATRELLRASPDRDPTKEQIAARAGVAPATVYNLVGSREQLWQALADSLIEDLRRKLPAPGSGEPLRRLRRVVSATVAMFVEDPAVSTRVLRRWEHSGLVLRNGPIGGIREAIEQAQEQGQLGRQVDSRALAWNIGTTCVGAVHQWSAGQLDDSQLRTRVMLATELTIIALATDPLRARLVRGLPRRTREAAR